MTKIIEAVRGMNDILPQQIHYWHKVEAVIREVTAAYGYSEIRFPIVEKTALFKRTIGDVTDIVEKEMYSFDDRNGDNLSMRPEGTAGCVRAAIQNGLLYNQTQRLWYCGPMFRHERPQKGRYRQFHQLGIETFGFEGPDIDAEIILLAANLWKKLGISDLMVLEINSLGTPECRVEYKQALVNYFQSYYDQLDADSQRRLSTNPLRILDSKNPDMQELIHNAPALNNYLDEGSAKHFEELQNILTLAGLKFKCNPRLVRGLDYYTQTVFEWVTDRLGAQSTVCAGGRFNGLVEQLGGKSTPAAGFGLGIERLILLVEEFSKESIAEPLPNAYLILVGDAANLQGLSIAERLRQAVPGLRLVVNCGGGNFKNQFKKADKSGARYALVVGDDEIEQNRITLKPLREQLEQQSLTMEQLIKQMENL